jgi:membrane-bound lytic murein transglycosylase B
MRKTPQGRRRRRTVAIVASAIVTLPAAFSSAAASNLVNTADNAPLDTHSAGTFPPVPSELGATGSTPHDTTLSPQLIHDAGNPAALATGAGPRANLPSGPLGIPGVVLDAYLKAQQVLATQQPNCHLPWWLLAGIGKIESGQAENGEVDAAGNTLRPILGPELNGQHGYAALPAILGGRWTGDPVWQRAVGPMQFLPSTWLEWGGGGNPNNVYDADVAAGKYLCNGGRDLSVPAQQAAAVFSYNHSDSYVQIVLIWANAYRNGVTPLPEIAVPPQPPVPPGTTAPSTTTVVPPPTSTSSTPPPTSATKPPTSTTVPPTTGTTPPTTDPTTTPPTTTLPPCPTSTTEPPTTTPTPDPTTTPAPPTCAAADPPTTTTTPTAS